MSRVTTRGKLADKPARINLLIPNEIKTINVNSKPVAFSKIAVATNNKVIVRPKFAKNKIWRREYLSRIVPTNGPIKE
jgi:hypothetical protein